MPGNGTANVRRPLFTLPAAVRLAPVTSVWAGEPKHPHPALRDHPPTILAATSGSTPFSFSAAVGDVQHAAIIGPTGAGKSVLLSLLLAQYFRYPGAQVMSLDKGYSQLALATAAGGAHYDLAPDPREGAHRFAPLAHLDTGSDLQRATDWLLALLEITGLDATPALQKTVGAGLRDLRQTASRSLATFAVKVQSHAIRDALAPYVLDGPYAHLFDAETSSLRSDRLRRLRNGARPTPARGRGHAPGPPSLRRDRAPPHRPPDPRRRRRARRVPPPAALRPPLPSVSLRAPQEKRRPDPGQPERHRPAGVAPPLGRARSRPDQDLPPQPLGHRALPRRRPTAPSVSTTARSRSSPKPPRSGTTTSRPPSARASSGLTSPRAPWRSSASPAPPPARRSTTPWRPGGRPRPTGSRRTSATTGTPPSPSSSATSPRLPATRRNPVPTTAPPSRRGNGPLTPIPGPRSPRPAPEHPPRSAFTESPLPERRPRPCDLDQPLSTPRRPLQRALSARPHPRPRRLPRPGRPRPAAAGRGPVRGARPGQPLRADHPVRPDADRLLPAVPNAAWRRSRSSRTWSSRSK